MKTWEQRKLDNVAEFSKGRGYSKGDLIELGTPIILYGRLYTNYETSISDVDTYVEAKDGSVYSRGGEVIVPASGESAEDIARAATVDKSGILLGGDLNVVMPNEDINSGFLAISISNGNPQRELAKRAQGKSVVHIHNEEIRNLRVPFPIKVEQNKIVEYFFNLDHLITLHQRKCYRFIDIVLDAWEQRKFGDLYCKVSEKNDLSFGSDKIISVANMYFKEDVKDSSEEYMRTYNVMRLGDIAFEGNKSKNYAHGRFVENTIGDGIVSHVFDVFRPIAEYDLYFWKYLINNEDVMGRIMTRCTKASTMMTNLVTNDFLKEEIMVPSLDEQRKIGKYLDDLDNLITLHQRKCEETKSLKKYMLQKMFPENGKCVPEIRFSGFSDDWEQRKFSEFVKNVAVRNREGLELECYAVTNDRGFISQKDAHDDFGYMVDVDTTAYNIVPPNSFAYNPARINVGSIGYYAGTENVIVSSLYEVFQTADYVDDRFLWHWFKSEHFPKWIERLQEGSVRLYFYYDKLIQCEIKMPSLEEQMKIGAYFNHLDHLITLHQHKCDELQKLKKFMLQNMFV